MTEHDELVTVEGDVRVDLAASILAEPIGDTTRYHTAVRALLIRLRHLDDQTRGTTDLLREVERPYKRRLETLENERTSIRATLQRFLAEHGDKVAIPDAGTVYLSTRGPQVAVTDEQALLAWWEKDAGREIPLLPAKPDMQEIKHRILDEMKNTGEVPPSGSGVDVIASARTLNVRLA